MLLPHVFLALFVMMVWGFNFVAIKLALLQLTPLAVCFFRFLLASIPAVFFVKRPNLPFRKVILYGMLMFVGQFSLLFISMKMGMSPGLAAILLQVQCFFTILFSVVLLGEKTTTWQILGGLISLMGIGVVGLHTDTQTSMLGVVLIIMGAASWGLGNFFSKQFGNVDMVSVVIWSSLVSCPVFLALALVFEGRAAVMINPTDLSLATVLGIAYIVYASTLVGYSAWTWLLNKYPATVVGPFTLLVPIFAMLSSSVVLGEPLESWKITAGALVISGICINIFGARYWTRRVSVQAST